MNTVDPGAAIWPVVWLIALGLLGTLVAVGWILVEAYRESIGTLTDHSSNPVLIHGTPEEVPHDHRGEAGVKAAQD